MPPTLLALTTALLLAGCATPQGRYRDLFLPLTRMGVSPDQLQAFPAYLVQPDSHTPAPHTRLVLDTAPQPILLESDAAGQILIPIRRDLLRENPPVRIQPNGHPKGVNLVLKVSATLDGAKPQSVQVRAPTDLNKTGDAHCAVFHQPGDEALARRIHSALVRTRRTVHTVLGLQPQRWSVLLETQPQQKDVLYLTVPAPGYDQTWRCFKEEWHSGHFMDTNPHEWTESTLVAALDLYADPRNRFIGDGLAEYVTWKVNGLPKDYLDRLSPAQLGDRQTVDLLTAFQAIPGKFYDRRKIHRGIEKHGFSPGYALAFAFWHQLVEEHGPQLPAAFIHRLTHHSSHSPSAEDALAHLIDLTGNAHLPDRLRHADIAAARTRLQRLIP